MSGAAASRTEFEFLLVQKKFMAAPNKWQLVNPLAPRQYGSGAQVLVADPQDLQERPYAYIDIVSIAAASGLRSLPVYVPAEDSQRGFHLRRTASRRVD